MTPIAKYSLISCSPSILNTSELRGGELHFSNISFLTDSDILDDLPITTSECFDNVFIVVMTVHGLRTEERAELAPLTGRALSLEIGDKKVRK